MAFVISLLLPLFCVVSANHFLPSSDMTHATQAPVPVCPTGNGQLLASLVPAPGGHDRFGFRLSHPHLLEQALQVAAVQPGPVHAVVDEQAVVANPLFAPGLHQVSILQFAPVVEPAMQYLPRWQIFGN